jgi:cytidylate kinase
MIVTIDGPAGSGKSTAARLLARRLGVAYLDTGAMYRAVTLAALRRGIDLADEAALAEVARTVRIDLEPRPDGCRVVLDGADVSLAIRDNELSRQTHYAASNPGVRACLVQWQQRLGRQWGSLVTEGRDQGTVVFPQAEFKLYLDASDEVRAARRQKELAARGQTLPLNEILDDLRRRDQRDRSRNVGPLRVPEGAIVVDTGDLTIEAMVDRLYHLVTGGSPADGGR